MTSDDASVELAETFAEVARVLAAAPDVDRMLDLLVSLVVATVDAADAAGISEIHGRRIASTIASSSEARAIDQLQDEAGQGPCIDAITDHEVFLVEALSEDRRWPEFGRLAGERSGFESVLSVRLFKDETTMGALNLYAIRRAAFDDHDVAVASLFAAHAALALFNVREVAQLHRAVESRDVIGRAKGILVARAGISDDEAYELLRLASQRTNEKLRIVAARVADRQDIERPAP